MLNEQSNQQFIAEISHISSGVQSMVDRFSEAMYEIQESLTAPHLLMKPVLKPDGDMWCVLYGSDLMEGVAGFGKTPQEAMSAFDKEWRNGITPAAGLALNKENTDEN